MSGEHPQSNLEAVCDQSMSGQELRKAEHYRIKQVWLEQCVRLKQIWLDHTIGEHNFADAMTKPTSASTFIQHRDVYSGLKPVIPLSAEIIKILESGRAKYVTGASPPANDDASASLIKGGCWKLSQLETHQATVT